MMRDSFRLFTVVGLACWLGGVSIGHAYEVDEYITSQTWNANPYLDHGGTESDPYVYGVNGSAGLAASTYLGFNNDYNVLVIDDGDNVQCQYGVVPKSDHNTIVLSGTTTVFQPWYLQTDDSFSKGAWNFIHLTEGFGINVQDMQVGVAGDDNAMLIDEGASVEADSARVGSDASRCMLTLSGAGTSLDVTESGLLVGYYDGASDNQVMVSGGASLIINQELTIGGSGSANNNHVTVDGVGSMLNASTTVNLGGSFNSGNLLTIQNGARAVSGGFYTTTGNYLQMASGTYLIQGNFTVAFGAGAGYYDGNVQLWDGGAWVAANTLDAAGQEALNYGSTYFADESAAAASGYSGYAGYTLLEGGQMSIPEPGTLVMLAFAAAGITAFRRISRADSKAR